MRRIAQSGGRASVLMLPEIGIRGNSYMLMMDRNNVQIANMLRQCIAENVAQ